MVVSKWSDLAKLADLAFEAQSQKLAKLKAEEAELVRQRDLLTNMNEEALQAFSGVHPAHWHSGDFHWQSWVGENKQRLGSQQAKIRAMAEMQKPELRKAFGRKSVLAEIMKQETQ